MHIYVPYNVCVAEKLHALSTEGDNAIGNNAIGENAIDVTAQDQLHVFPSLTFQC